MSEEGPGRHQDLPRVKVTQELGEEREFRKAKAQTTRERAGGREQRPWNVLQRLQRTEETPVSVEVLQEEQDASGEDRRGSSPGAHSSCSSRLGFPPGRFLLVILVTHFWAAKYQSPFACPHPGPALCTLTKTLPH